MTRIDRRSMIACGAGLLAGGLWSPSTVAAPSAPKSIAAIATVYRKNSHADVIITKILKGWKHDGGAGPKLQLASLYVEQVGDDDMSRDLAREHGFRLAKSIGEAVTLGTDSAAVDGVLSIAEHGEYPWNELGQHLYPRRRFFDGILNVFERSGKVVPVFNDKHPGPAWADALWMHQRATKLRVPWMAGSSLPVSFRDPDVSLPIGSEVDACVGVGYSGLDVYGFHTLDFLQCFMERRDGAESGVRWVQSLPLRETARLLDESVISREVLSAGLRSSKTSLKAVLANPPDDGALFLIQYRDGLLVPVLMLPGLASAISVALQVPGQPILSTRAEERSEPRYPHFAYLLKAIEQMLHTGQPAYPVERTVLSAGMLDRLLTSRHRGGTRLETPELEIAYRPTDYPHAPHVDLMRTF